MLCGQHHYIRLHLLQGGFQAVQRNVRTQVDDIPSASSEEQRQEQRCKSVQVPGCATHQDLLRPLRGWRARNQCFQPSHGQLRGKVLVLHRRLAGVPFLSHGRDAGLQDLDADGFDRELG